MIPDRLTREFTIKTEYYKVLNINIDSFIDEVFLKSFVSNGMLLYFKYNRCIIDWSV